MITRISALLDRSTREHVLNDRRRGRAIARLDEEGFTIHDIALALNCSQTIVMMLLIKWGEWLEGRLTPLHPLVPGPIDVHRMHRHHRGVLLYRRPRTEAGRMRENKELAQHLSREIMKWLFQLDDLSNQDRREVCGYTQSVLADSPLNSRGEAPFNCDRAVSELLRIWHPKPEDREPNFNRVLARWLSSWIRFWTIQPTIWNMALDLVYEELPSAAQAA